MFVHNPAQLQAESPVERRAQALLYPRHIGRNSAAGNVLVELLRRAIDGVTTITRRTDFATSCHCAESTMRSALKTLEAARIIETSRPEVRGPILVRVGIGPRPAARPDRQQDLFPELAHVAEPPALRVVADSTGDDQESDAGRVRAQEATDHGTTATAPRSCAAHVRGATAHRPTTPPPKTISPRAENAQALSAADFAKLYPHIVAGLDDETARDLRIPIPIPIPSPSGEAQLDTPPPAPPADSGNVEARREEGIATGGQLVQLAEQVRRRVRLDTAYGWLAWSFALLVVQGPLSEHDLWECLAGSGGNGKAFTGAIKARLHTRDPPTLARFSLLGADGSPQLHRFPYLRRALRTYGIELRPEDTQPPGHPTPAPRGARRERW